MRITLTKPEFLRMMNQLANGDDVSKGLNIAHRNAYYTTLSLRDDVMSLQCKKNGYRFDFSYETG